MVSFGASRRDADLLWFRIPWVETHGYHQQSLRDWELFPFGNGWDTSVAERRLKERMGTSQRPNYSAAFFL